MPSWCQRKVRFPQYVIVTAGYRAAQDCLCIAGSPEVIRLITARNMLLRRVCVDSVYPAVSAALPAGRG